MQPRTFNPNRREFLKKSLLIAAGVGLAPVLAACGEAAPAASPSSPRPSSAAASSSAPASSAAASSSAPAASISASAAASSAAASPAASAASSAAPRPATANNLNTAYAVLAPSLDPLDLISTQGFQAQRLFHEALVILDDKGNINPQLAESWKSLDPTTWQFSLRKDVKFHNGDAFTAEAVVAAVDRLVKTTEPSHQNLKSRMTTFASAKAVDANTVNITTNAPDPIFLRRLTMLFITNPKLYGDKAILSQPIGTGPYRPTAFSQGNSFTGEAVANHWRAKPTYTSFKHQQIPEPVALTSALKAGDIDVAIDVPASVLGGLQGPNLKTFNKSIASTWLYDLNATADTPMKDKRVRQAMNYAIDKEELIKNMFGGAGRISDGQLVGPEGFGYDSSLKPYSFDLEKAKQLMSQANAGGFAVKVGLVPLGQEMTQAMQGYLRKINIDLQIEMKQPALYVTGTSANNPPRENVWWWRADWFQTLDAAQAHNNFTAASGAGRVVTPEWENLMVQASKEMDTTKRAALLKQAAGIFREESTVIFLHQHGLFWAYNSKVTNFQARYDVSVPYEELGKA